MVLFVVAYITSQVQWPTQKANATLLPPVASVEHSRVTSWGAV